MTSIDRSMDSTLGGSDAEGKQPSAPDGAT